THTSTVTPPTTPDVYPLSLHDALPISPAPFPQSFLLGSAPRSDRPKKKPISAPLKPPSPLAPDFAPGAHRWIGKKAPDHREKTRSEEHTSELQSRENLVCRLLLEKKTE